MTLREANTVAPPFKLRLRTVSSTRGFTSALIPLDNCAVGCKASGCATAQKGMRNGWSNSVAPSGALEHLGSRFDNVLDHPIDGEGRELFPHGALHNGDFVAQPF